MIAEQVHTDPAGADAMLTRLGVLLRSSFVETDRERVPLRRELELLESYVEIMQGRFRGRLTFSLDVDPATLDALVPRFILQPLVENAIKHGVEPREEGGCVTVSARRQGEALALEVRDNGDGLWRRDPRRHRCRQHARASASSVRSWTPAVRPGACARWGARWHQS
jgi:LytS/YehU family sensor histidine kinase